MAAAVLPVARAAGPYVAQALASKAGSRVSVSKFDVDSMIERALAGRSPQQIQLITSEVKTLGHAVAHQLGLTEDEEYVGWKVLALLAFELWELRLKAPAQMAWHIEQQVAGVLDQAFKFLGGTGSALAAGVSSFETAVVNDVTAAEHWLIGWI